MRPEPPASDPPHFRLYGDYAGTEPAFFPADALPWVDVLRRHWRVIREEFEDHVARHGGTLPVNFVPDAVEVTGWKGVTLFTCLRRYRANYRAFPRTVAVLESIPEIASAFVNLLEPHAELPPHHGDSNLFHRAHLGLIVPGGPEECGMDVDGERTGWAEGEVFVFNDARRHTVWNRTGRPRVVLVCDVVKPHHGPATPRLCGRVLGTIAVTLLQARLPGLRRLPRPALRALHACASAPFQVYLTLFGMRPRRSTAAAAAPAPASPAATARTSGAPSA